VPLAKQSSRQHAWPVAQAFLHDPQLVLSADSSTHLLAQHSGSPASGSAVAHPASHFPQVFTSVVVSVQVPPQSVWPVGQGPPPSFIPASPPAALPPSIARHFPAEHTWPLAQALLQAPQSRLLVMTFTQLLLQDVRPVPQADLQAPAVQVEPAAHTFAHFPQLLLSELVVTHWPLHAVVPFWQVAAHFPVWQA
jgi:hypothetical protein